MRYTVPLLTREINWEGEAASLAEAIGLAVWHMNVPVSCIDFSKLDLSGIPVVPNIDQAILDAIESRGFTLNMDCWHGTWRSPGPGARCGTTHCRAGFAVYLAGRPGFDLEDEASRLRVTRAHSTAVAGALIYAASRPGVPIPDFYASDEEAMTDLRECATHYSKGSSDG